MVSVNLAVVSGKRIIHAENLHQENDRPVNLTAIKGARYVLMQGEDIIGPQLVKVKRTGKDLWLMLQGKNKPQLIIEHFYDQPGEIIGLGEDQQWHAYLSADADASFNPSALEDGAQSAVLLAQATVTPLENLEVDTGSSNALLYGLLGMGALASLAALVITQHSSGGSQHHNNAPEQHDPSPLQSFSPASQIHDDIGNQQGLLLPGKITDDTQPTLSGGGLHAGSIVQILDNGKPLGSTLVNAQGNWSFTPEHPLQNGTHEFVVVVTGPDGSISAPSEPTHIIVDSATEYQEMGLESLLPAGSDLTEWAAASLTVWPDLPTHTVPPSDDMQRSLDELLSSSHHTS